MTGLLTKGVLSAICPSVSPGHSLFSPGYANFGSDIGGYRSGNGTLGRSKQLLIRWAQLGAFSPLMENGGNKEHRPWAFDEETLEIYKK